MRYDLSEHINGQTIRTGKRFNKVSGITTWLEDGMYHRVDGPAVITRDGNQHWWLFDDCVTEEEVLQYAIKTGNKQAIKSIIWKKYEQ